MIRRWSRLKLIKINLSNKYFFNKYLFKSFKKSIKFKKYSLNETNFNRKSLGTLKHKYNWSLYRQIFKFWTIDYMFAKNIAKFQYLNKFESYQLAVVDATHFNTKKNKLIWSPESALTAYISKKLKYFFDKSNLNKLNFNKIFYKDFVFLYNFFTIKNDVFKTYASTPFLIKTENEYYPFYLLKSNDDWNDNKIEIWLNDFKYTIFLINLKKIVELYKILIFLWYPKIKVK